MAAWASVLYSVVRPKQPQWQLATTLGPLNVELRFEAARWLRTGLEIRVIFCDGLEAALA